MMTDTGNFSYNSNDPEIYQAVAEPHEEGRRPRRACAQAIQHILRIMSAHQCLRDLQEDDRVERLRRRDDMAHTRRAEYAPLLSRRHRSTSSTALWPSPVWCTACFSAKRKDTLRCRCEAWAISPATKSAPATSAEADTSTLPEANSAAPWLRLSTC